MDKNSILSSIASMKAERDEINHLLAHACKRQSELRRRKGGNRFLLRYKLEIKTMIDNINMLNANIQGLEESLK